MSLSPLPQTFYEQSVQDVARGLLGARLVRNVGDVRSANVPNVPDSSGGAPTRRMAGYIVETEAYQGESDLACHARAGRTPRTEVMYGPAGRAYVYFIYGIHWMLNCVTGPEGTPEAVLIRAVLPAEGFEPAEGQNTRSLWRRTNGPAKVCRTFGIDGNFNGADLTDREASLVIEPGQPVEPGQVLTGPRVGIDGVPEPWRSKPWRFRIDLPLWQAPREAHPISPWRED